ncbi:hypothetical protein LVD15_18075 [Fulvivirga maritima]|uniref:hypothetical protein n=1 Tax=Fulvivirga maritima TaxID=2904247 RepID=UPI001F1F5849|nr:hypothetical protein [Fulvivirga maritima]UII25203.1 hypothetical protein LVD15_18075 [Fulvivirga maritima]
MKYTLLLLVPMLMMACLKEETYGSEYFIREFLANNDGKSWHISPNEDQLQYVYDTTCSLFSARSLDNTFRFHADNTLEFDNGAIVNYPGCDSCCVDAPSGVGYWSIQGSGENKSLLLVVNDAAGEADTLIYAQLANAYEDRISLRNTDDNSMYDHYWFSLITESY